MGRFLLEGSLPRIPDKPRLTKLNIQLSQNPNLHSWISYISFKTTGYPKCYLRLLKIIFIYLVTDLLIQPRKPHKRDMLSDFCVCSQSGMLYKLLSLFIYFMST